MRPHGAEEGNVPLILAEDRRILDVCIEPALAVLDHRDGELRLVHDRLFQAADRRQ